MSEFEFEVLGVSCEVRGYREYLVHKNTRQRIQHFNGNTVEDSIALFFEKQAIGSTMQYH